MCEKLVTKATLVNAELWTYWKQDANFDERFSSERLAELIEWVIVPTINQEGVSGKFIGLLKEAEPYLASLAKRLEDDAKAPGAPPVPRVFEEVRVTPEQLDASLREFNRTLLDMAFFR